LAGGRAGVPFGAAPFAGAPFALAAAALRSRSTARLGFRFNPGRFMADALYINRREEEP